MDVNSKPLIVQGDGSLLLEVHHPQFEEARGEISAYTELEKSPEHIHSYRLSPLSLWNAASAGWKAREIEQSINKWSRYPVPESLIAQNREILSRWGCMKLLPGDSSQDELLLQVDDPLVQRELESRRSLIKYLTPTQEGFTLKLFHRGTIKSELMHIGYPVMDMVPLHEGESLHIKLRKQALSGKEFNVRAYQKDALNSFLGNGEPGTGFGVIVMPCGSGKTIVGLTALTHIANHTLILTTNIAAVHQWRNELLDKTELESSDIAEYTGERKRIGPVTIATYQILTWSPDKRQTYPHFNLFHQHRWGLIIYDEVHLLPASVFRVTAEIQTIHRLGLTATLIREDDAQDQVFSLVGPKRYDVPWKTLEEQGWIATAICREIRINLPTDKHISYAMAEKRRKMRIASENPVKIDVAEQLIEQNPKDQILVIGQYISQLKLISKRLEVPIITGATPNRKREELYNAFRRKEHRVLVVSKVANFAIDLPAASMAIQLSGSYGSRQEEAQRLGRILRPGERLARFFSLVSRVSVEEIFAANRQRFLTEQGYKYEIEIWK